MNTRLLLGALAMCTAGPLQRPMVAAASAAPAATDTGEDLLSARAGETRVIPTLRGLVFTPTSPAAGAKPVRPADPIDVRAVPALQSPGFQVVAQLALGKPASVESLERVARAARTFLRFSGHPFVSVHVPPQDVTDGDVQVVVAEARADGVPTIAGARFFSEQSYLTALRQPAGAPVDATVLAEDVAWLNRNPFRQVSASAEAGRAPGTTRLALRTQESRPFAVNAGYANTGTRTTDEDRVSAGFQWGNALGRGDLFSYNFARDPRGEHLRSHSGGYTAFLPWRQVLSLQGAWSHIDSAMPAPFTQAGTSWQVGARYEIPLRAPRAGWTQHLSLSADFKASDNTLEFAAIPITDNLTHVAQVGATYGVGATGFGGQNSASVTLAASPGGLTARNRGRFFAGSRAGAEARYLYGKLVLSHRRPLAAGFSLAANVEGQLASGALLGSEQLNGGGASAVRGYRESSAFGDEGIVATAELHAPALALWKGKDTVDVLAFVDAAALRLRVDRESTDLASLGLGLNYQWTRQASVRMSYGWQLKALDRATESGRGHVSVNLSY